MVMEMVLVGWLPNWPMDTVLYGRNLFITLIDETWTTWTRSCWHKHTWIKWTSWMKTSKWFYLKIRQNKWYWISEIIVSSPPGYSSSWLKMVDKINLLGIPVNNQLSWYENCSNLIKKGKCQDAIAPKVLELWINTHGDGRALEGFWL